jgi:hypothetical protein
MNYSYNSVVGGKSNTINNSGESVIIGGYSNLIQTTNTSFNSNLIGGGRNNRITGSTEYSSMVGGRNNSLYNNSYSTIVGGFGNQIYDTVNSFIGGGFSNTISNGYFLTIGGGSENTVNNGSYNTIVGGTENVINATTATTGSYNTMVGGVNNQINNSYYSNILDGFNNQINNAGFVSSILGGYANKIDKHSPSSFYFNNWNSIQGGAFNKIYVSNGPTAGPNIEGGNIIGGGSSNYIYGDDSSKKANKNTILNGFSNKITGATSGFIGNGYKNEILSYNYSSIIANGIENKITDGYQPPGSPLLPKLPVFDPRLKPPGTLGNTIGGGGLNTIIGTVRNFAGGNNNTNGYLTDGKFNTIGGGYRNYVSGRYNTIAGGGRVQADFFSSISEGGNIISGNSSTIGGGLGHKIYGRYSTIGGGGFYSNVKPTVYGNTIIGNMSVIAGGFSNVIDTSPWYGYNDSNPGNSISAILGGSGNKIYNGRFSWSTIGGGHYNYVMAGSAFVGGGGSNIIGYGSNPIELFPDGGYSSVVGGYNNKIYSDYGFIGNGDDNSIFTGSTFSFIGNGYNNDMFKAEYSTILVGKSNYIGYSSYSGILGGRNNIINGQDNNYDDTFIIGSNITAISANTTHVERFNIGTVDTGSTATDVLVRESNGMVNTTPFSTVSGGLNGKYVELITGYTANVTQTITHNLGTGDEVVVDVIDTTNNERIGSVIDNYQTNALDLTLSQNYTSIKIVIIG